MAMKDTKTLQNNIIPNVEGLFDEADISETLSSIIRILKYFKT